MVKKIKIFRNFEINKAYKNSLILVGNFDGLHVGHQKLFKHAQKYKNMSTIQKNITFKQMGK